MGNVVHLKKTSNEEVAEMCMQDAKQLMTLVAVGCYKDGSPFIVYPDDVNPVMLIGWVETLKIALYSEMAGWE